MDSNDTNFFRVIVSLTNDLLLVFLYGLFVTVFSVWELASYH